jgi:hypothetical protein
MKLTLELLFDESHAAMIPRNKIETIGQAIAQAVSNSLKAKMLPNTVAIVSEENNTSRHCCPLCGNFLEKDIECMTEHYRLH